MAEPMVANLLEQESLFLVKDAPVIKRSVFAIYPHKSDKFNQIEYACNYFGSRKITELSSATQTG